MCDPELERLRAAVDDVNLRVRDALQERACLVAEIAELKHRAGLPIEDPSREAAILDATCADPGDGFDPAALRRIFASIFAESRRLASERSRRSR